MITKRHECTRRRGDATGRARRSLYLASVIDYNRAQLELLRAIGEPPSEGAAGAGFDAPLAPQEPAEFVPPAPAAGAP